MTWEYTTVDRALCNAVVLQLPVAKHGVVSGAPFNPGVPGSHRYEADEITINGRRYINIHFQFPPKMTSDGRKSKWVEEELTDDEPTYAFEFSGPREMNLNFSYVVESSDIYDPNAWTVQRITHYIRSLRGYPIAGKKAGSGGDGHAHENLIAYFKLWAIGGSHTQSIRIKAVDVKYGDSLIVPEGDPHLAFPLRADLSLNIGIWTPGMGEAGSDDHIERVRGLVPLLPVWY